jgi:hypothetical protein
MTVEEFVEKLKEFGSKVLITPLTEIEVANIELVLDRKFPEYYRQFLLQIGLKQDAICGLLDRIEDVNDLAEFLPDGQSTTFFHFAHSHNGEGYWLLRIDDPTDKNIYEYDYPDSCIRRTDKTFDQLLDESLQQLTQNKDLLRNNSEKCWIVEFSIAVDNVDVIIGSLKKEFDCHLSEDIGQIQVSSGGTIISLGKIRLQGADIQIKKKDHHKWETPKFCFNWNEPVADMQMNSLIKRIESRLKNDSLEVELLDYGIL